LDLAAWEDVEQAVLNFDSNELSKSPESVTGRKGRGRPIGAKNKLRGVGVATKVSGRLKEKAYGM